MPLVTLSGWWWRALPLAPKKRTPSTSSATGVIVIVLNGRNDSEKLDELLGAGEGTHLDYKETLDLATSADKLSIVKDLVSVSNRPGGGYLVIGVGDQMLTSRRHGSIDRKLLQCGCGAGSADGDVVHTLDVGGHLKDEHAVGLEYTRHVLDRTRTQSPVIASEPSKGSAARFCHHQPIGVFHAIGRRDGLPDGVGKHWSSGELASGLGGWPTGG